MKRENERRPRKAESAGCMVEANTWIKIGLSKSQAARLRSAAKMLLKAEHRTSAKAAWFLLNVAIANLPLLHQLLRDQSQGKFYEQWCEQQSRAVLRGLN